MMRKKTSSFTVCYITVGMTTCVLFLLLFILQAVLPMVGFRGGRDDQGLEYRFIGNRLEVTLPLSADILFDPGSDVLKADGRKPSSAKDK